MFSGIVEEVGTILECTDADGGVRLTVGCALLLDDLAPAHRWPWTARARPW